MNAQDTNMLKYCIGSKYNKNSLLGLKPEASRCKQAICVCLGAGFYRQTMSSSAGDQPAEVTSEINENDKGDYVSKVALATQTDKTAIVLFQGRHLLPKTGLLSDIRRSPYTNYF